MWVHAEHCPERFAVAGHPDAVLIRPLVDLMGARSVTCHYVTHLHAPVLNVAHCVYSAVDGVLIETVAGVCPQRARVILGEHNNIVGIEEPEAWHQMRDVDLANDVNSLQLIDRWAEGQQRVHMFGATPGAYDGVFCTYPDLLHTNWPLCPLVLAADVRQ